jgi:hypothetical protein
MRKDDGGYIVVETVGTFIPFVLLVVSILSLVNIVALQARVHFALTQAANTLSMYCYVLNSIGVTDNLATLNNKATEASNTINDVLSGINALSGKSGTGIGSENNRLFDSLQKAAGDPEAMVKNMAGYGVESLRSQATAELVEPMVRRYLAGAGMSAEEYLSSVKVANFNLTDCVLIDRNENVKLTAEYEVEYTFGTLRIPFGPTLKITQTVVTKAWLGGSGEGYRSGGKTNG